MDYVKKQLSRGRGSFSIQEIEQVIPHGRKALLAALSRLIKKGELASPFRGFYIIIPSEFHLSGGLPPDQLTVLLLEHWRISYYVGLLSAAQYYGVGHQQPQIFQVMLEKNRASIASGRAHLIFIANKNVQHNPVKLFKTPRGMIRVATPEVIALDLVMYPHQCGGLNQVITVLQELVEYIQIEPLKQLANASTESAWIQRLGYLFSLIHADSLAKVLASCLQEKKYYFKALDTQKPIKGFYRDKQWKLIINTEIEVDE